jgi:hypothetical protein
VDVHAYTQGGTVPSGEGAGARQQLATVATAERVIVHLVNLTHAGTWKGPIDELNVVGEQRVAVHLPPGRRVTGARLLVAGHEARLEHGDDGEAAAIVPSIADHEVVVLEMSDD